MHATDRIQRDIEEILEKNKWYYERRKNYYRNIGKPESRMITPLFIAGGSIAMLLKNPAQAAKLKSRFMRSEAAYLMVFSEKIPIKVWPKIVYILKKTETTLDKRISHSYKGSKFLSSWRNLTAFLTTARIFKRFSFSAEDLANLNESLFTEQLITESWKLIKEQESPSQRLDAKKPSFIIDCCAAMAKKYQLMDLEVIGKRSLPKNAR